MNYLVLKRGFKTIVGHVKKTIVRRIFKNSLEKIDPIYVDLLLQPPLVLFILLRT